FGHIVARLECCFARVRHAIKKLRCAVIVSNYGQHVAHAHTPDSRIDGGIESAHRDVPIRRQSRRVGLQIRTEAPFSRGFFLSAPSKRSVPPPPALETTHRRRGRSLAFGEARNSCVGWLCFRQEVGREC